MTLFMAGPGTCARDEKYRAWMTRTMRSSMARSANVRKPMVEFWKRLIVCIMERAAPDTATCCTLFLLLRTRRKDRKVRSGEAFVPGGRDGPEEVDE